MRLIDADALVDTLSVDPIGCAGCPEPEFMDELIDILDTAPTVEPTGDLISRADAKQQISEWATIITKPTLLDKDATMVVLDSLPSAEATIGDYPNDLISRSALMEYCSNQKSKSIDNNDIARFPSAEAEEALLNAYYDGFNTASIEALLSAEAVQGDGRNNIKRYPNCQMRTSLGNCDAIGGFCTSINAPICDAFHKLSEAVQGEWEQTIADGSHQYEYKCSECGYVELRPMNFCPRCGARMKGGDNNEID